jgi:tetratricopeptide (TPR) repeat protein
VTKNENTLKSSYFLLLIPVCLAAFLSSSRAQEPLPDLVARIKPSVVAIVTYDKRGKKLARGSGFYVAPNRVITNEHVVEDGHRIEVRSYDGKVFQVSKILDDDKEGDLVLLQTDDWPTGIKPLIVGTVAPREGERVIVVGNPLGLQGSISDGIVAAFRTIRGAGKLIQITAPISPGSSGSPVINVRGEVIGVATLYLEGGQNLNFAISSDRIVNRWPDLLTTSSDIPSKPPSRPTQGQLTAEQLFAKGDSFYGRQRCQNALPYFRQAIETNPNYAMAYLAEGFCKFEMKRLEEAIEDFWQVIRLSPEDSNLTELAYSNLGFSYYDLGQYDEAAESLKQSIKLNPSSYLEQHYLGLAFYELKRYRDALDHFRTAVILAPAGSTEQTDSIFSLGMTYSALGDRASALEQQKLLANIDPGKAKVLLSRVNNISGYWKSSAGTSYQIIDNGDKVVVKYYEAFSRDIKYEAEWKGEIIIGYYFSTDSKYRFVLRAVDGTHIWVKYHWGLDLKEPTETVLQRAIKESEKQPDEIWTKIQ